jgi:putative ABC transport system substrate-binding protein
MMADMERRQFLLLLGSAGAASAVLRPRPAQAQGARRIGVLMAANEDDAEYRGYITAFREALAKLGWTEGNNLRIDHRWGAVEPAVTQRLAQELVSLQPDLIVAQNTTTSLAVLQHTKTIPIVFATVVDPVGSGLVTSIARPGGNVTGFMTLEDSVAGKLLELLKEIAPGLTRVVFLYNPITAPFAEYYLRPFRNAASRLRVDPIVVSVREPAEIESVLAAQAQTPNTGLMTMPDTFLNLHRAQITALAAHHRLPAVYPFRIFTEAGGLMAYGSNLAENYPRVAAYADRILRGAKPDDLPVQPPAKFELVINMKAAKTLGLNVSLSLQVSADEVIE